MIPINQTDYSETGDCFAACVASVLEMPLEAMPDHSAEGNGEHWLHAWREFLKPMGLGIVWTLTCPNSIRQSGYAIGGFFNSEKRDGHCVVMLDGEITHDPRGDMDANHSSPTLQLKYLYFITSLDPAKHRKAQI